MTTFIGEFSPFGQDTTPFFAFHWSTVGAFSGNPRVPGWNSYHPNEHPHLKIDMLIFPHLVSTCSRNPIIFWAWKIMNLREVGPNQMPKKNAEKNRDVLQILAAESSRETRPKKKKDQKEKPLLMESGVVGGRGYIIHRFIFFWSMALVQSLKQSSTNREL